MTTTVWAALVAIVLVGADQAIKHWATTALSAGSIDLLPGVLSLTYHENFGAAFGILQNKRFFLVIVTALVLGAACYFILSGRLSNKYLVWSTVLIVAGGVGNLLDRIFNGYVIDYIYFELINFPVFNLADCCVVIGTCMVILYIFFEEKFKPHKGTLSTGEEQ